MRDLPQHWSKSIPTTKKKTSQNTTNPSETPRFLWRHCPQGRTKENTSTEHDNSRRKGTAQHCGKTERGQPPRNTSEGGEPRSRRTDLHLGRPWWPCP
uniref:Uncharacterized protein n=1 Tax=Arundo donax TaxID=35708 RepID=A0A0A8ZHV3_ARUDO